MKISRRYWYWVVAFSWAILRLRRRAVLPGVALGFALSLCWNWRHPYLYQSTARINHKAPDEHERLVDSLLEEEAVKHGKFVY